MSKRIDDPEMCQLPDSERERLLTLCHLAPQTVDNEHAQTQDSGPCPDEGCPGSIADGECSHCGSDFADAQGEEPNPFANIDRSPTKGNEAQSGMPALHTLEELKANARLIAAAPDLLAACVRLTKWKSLGSHYNLGSDKVKADLDAARRAIADAQGGVA